NIDRFIKLSNEENLEAVVVAEVTDTERLRMFWRGNAIVDIKRSFLDTNGETQETEVKVVAPSEYPFIVGEVNVKGKWVETLNKLNVCDKKGLIERFDSTIGSGTVLMPLGGKYSRTPAEGMVFKIPIQKGETNSASIMTYGFNPELGMWSPFHMAYYAVIESITKLSCIGGDYRKARLTFQEYFEKLGDKKERWGKPFSALLGAYKAQMDLEIPAIGGKDSMSGSFGEMDVPPTLVSFAVGMINSEDAVSPEFKKVGSKIILVKSEKEEDGTLKTEMFKNNLVILNKLITDKKVLSAYSLKFGGVAEGLSKMALGNKVGVKFNSLTNEELFGFNYGSFILEVDKELDEKELSLMNYTVIGETINEEMILSEELDLNISLDEISEEYERKLKNVFKVKINDTEEKVEEVLYKEESKVSPVIKVAKPKIVIPIFPGTNCEYDCKRAFERSGGDVREVVLRNYNKEALLESLDSLKKEIDNSQIIMIPGGFSAGDEPDGSAKFIVNILRNEKIKESVME
ncbi:phosphoribosylformylglycinamidine synthase subunit PurQ, partial [Clostridium saudiense]|nr:phosphoribosylformylglycinamidine synthase subunit PurQ [Clostridium saudiense]